MKSTPVVVLIILLSNFISAQNSISIDEYIQGKYKLDKPTYVQWIGATDKFVYLQNNVLWMGSSKSSKPKEYLNIVDFNKLTGKSITNFPRFTVLGTDTLRFVSNNNRDIVVLDVKKRSVIFSQTLDPRADSVNISKINTISYIIDNNLYVVNHEKLVKKITDNEKGIFSGDVVARNEFGIKSGVVWSYSGMQLAFYEKDVRNILNYPLLCNSDSTFTVKHAKYPFAGTENEKYKIGVYNLKDGSKLYLNTGPVTGYLTNVSWSPGGESIYVVFISRDQKKYVIKQFDAMSGGYIRTVLTESNDKYIEPENGLFFLKSREMEFLWLSERTGFNHLYHYTVDGDLLNTLTDGNWEISSVIGFDDKDQNVYFMGTTESAPYERHIYKVNIITLKVSQLTKIAGYHSGVLNKATGEIIDLYSSSEIPYVVSVLDAKGEVLIDYYKASTPYTGYSVPTVSIEKIKSTDGTTDLWMKVIKPSNFDESKKYPLVVDVYGGPHIQKVKNIWRNFDSQLPYYLAEQGYVVAMIDGRGSSGRGLAFENQIYKNLGKIESTDQIAAINYLKTKKWIDSQKIGVYGASYGGFMTIYMLLAYPDIFKTGVASYPVTDWKYYEIMYTERYMGTPADNPKGYAEACLNNKVSKLKSNLLILSGANDDVTVPIHSGVFVDACINNKIPIDYFVYPSSGHGIESLEELYHYYNIIIKYFNQNLR